MSSHPDPSLAQPPAGTTLKSLPRVLLERRATAHFLPDPIPDAVLNQILELAAQAPSGYNLQPWRFIIVRDAGNRKRLQQAAMNQEKVSEAPVVIIAVGMKDETKRVIEEVLQEGVRRGAGQPESLPATVAQARKFLNSFPMNVWVNRHTMIALTSMMLVAESFGYDTAPMEGFDPELVKHEFGIPGDAEVVALLAIGRMREPDKPYPGRFRLSRIMFQERFGLPWPDRPGKAEPTVNP